MDPSIRLTPASEKDIPLILRFIKELAEYEKLSKDCVATEVLLHDSLFGKVRYAEALIAHYENEPAGFAIFFYNFSTFLAQPGMYLEDLYVVPHLRAKGIGKALLERVARTAKERGCGRFEWAVLDWNEPSIAFYKKLGAVPLADWTVFRVTGRALDKLASLQEE
jgi:GNAT superfamily N-acetyltransferase